jgi:HlyD family secretion protein
MTPSSNPFRWCAPLVVAALLLPGCRILPESVARSDPENRPKDAAIAVETILVSRQLLQDPIRYTGTTRPEQEVLLRAQVEGRILDLTVDVGDPVSRGQLLAQIDDQRPRSEANAEAAEVAARQSEVLSLAAEVSAAIAQRDQALLSLRQAQAESQRLDRLLGEGVVSEQDAERGRTAVATAAQVVRSAQQQVQTRQQGVAAAQRRVTAQVSVANQAREQQLYAQVRSPLNGVVLARPNEVGNLARLGDEILRLGDLSRLKVTVSVSELDLSQIRVGQSVQVTLDAFPQRPLMGRISRIAPAADPRSRLIPVEITLPNPDRRAGSGLLARVSLTPPGDPPVVIPLSALSDPDGPQTAAGPPATGTPERATVFVLRGQSQPPTVAARTVQLGPQSDGKVVVRRGLQAGETLVVRSQAPLQAGQVVRLSILSQTKGG